MILKANSFTCETCGLVISKFHVEAEKSVFEIVNKERVVYRNETRYRLERDYFHSVTDYALRRLENGKAYNKGLKIVRTALPGRKSTTHGTPNVFYKSEDAKYDELVPIMKKKLELSTFVSELAPSAGLHAQCLWRDAFEDLGFEIVKDEAHEYEDRRASVEGDIDFIAKKDDFSFGVEIKNGLEYPDDLAKKVQIAIELKTIPVIIVRRVSWDVYKNLKKYGVLTKIYETSIMPASYESVVEDCKKLLCMPLISLDSITGGTKEHLVKKVLSYGFENKEKLVELNESYLKAVKSYRAKLSALNKEVRFV
jgi:hypothetical protein